MYAFVSLTDFLGKSGIKKIDSLSISPQEDLILLAAW